jgi:hypothetical protein
MRITLGTLTAAITVLAVAAPGVAQAAPVAGSPAAPAVAKKSPTASPRKAVKHTKRAPGGRLVVGRTATATAVTAGSTGDGPADQKECNKRAANINRQLTFAMKHYKNGNSDTGAVFADSARKEIDDAMDRGCFIVY